MDNNVDNEFFFLSLKYKEHLKGVNASTSKERSSMRREEAYRVFIHDLAVVMRQVVDKFD